LFIVVTPSTHHTHESHHNFATNARNLAHAVFCWYFEQLKGGLTMDSHSWRACWISFAQRRAFGAVAGLFSLIVMDSQIAMAAAMRCSGEQRICITGCNKSPDRSTIRACVTACGARQSLCMKTGCWDSGFQKYCGLLKQ